MSRSAAEERLAFRRQLRREATDAERKLWSLLRCRRFSVRFRRQHPVGPYVLDFYCPSRRLAVELDGGQHFEAEEVARDDRRTRFLAAHGIRVLRFTNAELFLELDAVLQSIWNAVAEPPSPRPSPPAPRGERE